MPSVMVPPATARAVDHADWLELEAIRVSDRNSSVQDLTSAIRRLGDSDVVEDERAFEDPDDPVSDRGGETTEPIAEAAFEEIEDRQIACDGAYPFQVHDGAIQGSRRTPTSVYTFLLLLTQFGKDAGPDGLNVAQLFEEVSELAVSNCLGGKANGVESTQFGFPRRISPAGFRDAVDDLCRRTGEGVESRARPTRSDQKDAGLDIVAWRPFPDRRRGLVMSWGQCATGDNWPDKVTELHPANWAAAWLKERPHVIPMPAFFVPRRIDLDRWDVTGIHAGVLFDRCRLAAFTKRLPRALRDRVGVFNRHVITEELS